MRLSQKHKNNGIYLLARIFRWLARSLPRPIGLVLFGSIGKFVWLFPNIEKQRTLDHLRLIYGSTWNERQILLCARSVFVNIAKNFYDALYLRNTSQKKFDAVVHHDALNSVNGALAAGKGMIAITGHIGCFEMLLPFMARKGFKSFAIGRRSFDDRIDALIREGRTGAGFEYFHRSENPRLILRNLKEGKTFGVLIDQDTNVEGVFAHFLGKLAYTPSAPIRIAMRFNIPVMVFSTSRGNDNSHHVYIKGPLTLTNTGSFENDLVRNAEMINSLLGETITAFPDQWVWMHRRWRRTPESQGAGILNIETIH